MLALTDFDYPRRFRQWLGREYERSTIFDHPRLRATDDKLLRFFVLGEALPKEEVDALPLSALEPWLRRTGDDVRLELALSVYPVGGTSLYLFSDPPGKAGHGRLSATSLFLLRELAKEKEQGASYQGEAADLGSGVGIQALALLLLHPGLERVWGVETEPEAATISELNARINGLEGRFRAVPKLGPAELHLVVSNPSADIVPAFLKEGFPVFGFGGADGLAHAREVLRDSVNQLKPGGRLQLFAQWGVKGNGQLLFEDFVDSEFPDLKVTKVPVGGRERLRYTFWDSESYARSLARFVGATEVAPIERALQDEGIERVVPFVVKLEKPA